MIGKGNVIIGENVGICYDVLLITSMESYDAEMSDLLPEERRRIRTGNIVIEDDVYVGSKAVISVGDQNLVRIGRGSCIGANSYIDKDIESYTVLIPHQKLVKKHARSKRPKKV